MIDGGFSFPHRTLGANMLKDRLYGVDFDGTPVLPAESRMGTSTIESTFASVYLGNAFREVGPSGSRCWGANKCQDCHPAHGSSYFRDSALSMPLGVAQALHAGRAVRGRVR
jgi:hypothetical protein